MPIKPEDFASLSGEEAYVVAVLRNDAIQISPHRPTDAILWAGNLPVCTWPTLFSLLGREVLVPDDATGGYALAPAWVKSVTDKTKP